MNITSEPMAGSDAQASRPSAGRTPVITAVERDERVRAQNLESFRFRHSLAGNSFMTLPAIRKLAVRMLEEKRFRQVVCVGGTIRPGERMTEEKRVHAAVDALESIDTSNAWLRLTLVDEVNEQFKAISEQFYDDLSELYGQDIRARTFRTFATLFISSPGEITPYHMDHTWNFLLQVSGRKTVHLFDPNDPRILSQHDKERWYMERKPGIQLKESPAGIAYDLEPGEGVHHPINAPHWVQNGPEVSVSLSLGLCLRDSMRDACVHQVNYVIRRLGMEPTLPGHSKWRDAMKVAVIGALARRTPRDFDDVLFSGKRRFDHALRFARIRI